MKKLLLVLGLAAAATAATVGAGNSRPGAKEAVSRNMSVFNSVFKELNANYVDTIDADAITRTAIDAMLQRIDPYTEYYSTDELEDLTTISSGRYGGIGAYISKRDGKVYISQPVYDAPAHKAGLRHGDIFLEVNGMEVTPETGTDEVSRRLRGQAGSTVTVKIQRPWVEDSILEFEIVRRDIDVNPLPYYGVDSTGIGYLRLNTFNEKSAGAVTDALADMRRDGNLQGLVIDLRGNGGGLLESAVQIVGLFVPKGTEVVRTRGADPASEKIYKTTRKPVDTELPLVVMVNGSTASSSEIVAGALQDLDRAVIVGERSYGKGLVQTSRPVAYNGMLKVTVARYYIPSGRLIQAIDYSHRDADGSAIRIPDSLTRVWHTAAGREVRDGGGITPDVAVSDTAMNRLLYNVLTDNWAFDFANRYRALHPALTESWEVDDSVFTEFKNFIDPDHFKYDRMCEMGIDYLRDAARIEGYMSDSVAAQIDILAGMLRHNLDHDLNFNRPKLESILDSEIGERYFDNAEMVRRSLRYDLEVDTAKAVLLNIPRYNSILQPQK